MSRNQSTRSKPHCPMSRLQKKYSDIGWVDSKGFPSSLQLPCPFAFTKGFSQNPTCIVYVTPKIPGVIFFFLATRQVCRDRMHPGWVVFAPWALSPSIQALSRVRQGRCLARIPIASACLPCVPDSVVGDRVTR